MSASRICSARDADVRSSSGGSNSAGAAVLTSQPLVGRITEFQSGYPQVVAAMIRSATKEQFLYAKGGLYDVYNNREGVLPRLAVAVGDLSTLKLLFKLKTVSQSDPLLQFADVMRLAIHFKSMDILKGLVELKAQDPAWEWEPYLLSHAMHSHDGNSSVLEVLELLYHHLPLELRVLWSQDMVAFARKGNLEVVRWLLEHGSPVDDYIATVAVGSRNADLVAYLYEHTDARCRPDEVIDAARRGDLEIVKIVVAGQTKETCERVINDAAGWGHLKVVKYLVENGIGVQSATVIDAAVAGRCLDIVQYLHEHLPCRCLPTTPKEAAAGERLPSDSESSQPQVARSTGCTARALENAVILRQMEIAEFLCTHRKEGDVGAAMVIAAQRRDLEMVKLLHKHLGAHDSAYPAVTVAAQTKANDVVRFLCASQESKPETPTFLTRALADGEDWLVRVLSAFSTMAELVHARDFAVEQKRAPQLIQVLERWIRSLTRDATGKRRS